MFIFHYFEMNSCVSLIRDFDLILTSSLVN